MKKKQGILVLLFLLLGITSVFADNSNFVLVIDAGHGGDDPGALGEKTQEKDVNLAVAKLAGEYIAGEHKDVKIVYTRTKDVYLRLKERTAIANKANANLFISIHSNSAKKHSLTGAEVFILGLHRTKENLAIEKRENSVILMEDNYKERYKGYDPGSPGFRIIYEVMQEKYMQQSLEFASMVQKELVSTAKRKNNGVKQAGFWVLVGAGMPSILIELDFISNRESEKFIGSGTGQEKMARAIANAFSEYKKGFDYRINRNTRPQENEDTPASENEPIKNSEDEPIKHSKPDNMKKTVYKVQIFVSDIKLPKKSKRFKGYNAAFYVENNLYKYTYGESSNWNEITKIRKSVSKDFKDAFIVKFENGKKVPIK